LFLAAGCGSDRSDCRIPPRLLRLKPFKSIKKILFIAAIFFVFSRGEGAEVKDPIDIAMEAAMYRNSSTAGMCEAISQAQKKWEARLNAAWAKLKSKMTADEFAELQKAQRAWLTYRDLQIQSYSATYGKMEGTMWIPCSASAIMEITKQRVEDLETILGLLDER
jgi:uncharacterized protein YecT (DUF1311 family)